MSDFDFNYAYGDCQDSAIHRIRDGLRDDPYQAAEAQAWATLAVAAAINRLAEAVEQANRPAPRR